MNVVQSLKAAMQYADVCHSATIAETLDSFTSENYSLVVMDIRLSEVDGMEVLHIIRGLKNIPILVLASKLSAYEKAAIFREGATAFLEKPINMIVCVAQINSLIQLYIEAQVENRIQNPLTFGTELVIDPMYRQVIIDGELIKLTRTEFDLLYCLAKHPGQVWSRNQLYRYVWNDDLDMGGDNTVRTHIGNLRKKLADAGKNYVQNSRGIGYKFILSTSEKKK